MKRANLSGTACGILLSAAMLFATTACTSHTQPGARHAQPGYAQPGQAQPGHTQPDSVSARPGTNADMERKASNFRKSPIDVSRRSAEMEASMKELEKELDAILKDTEDL